MKIREWFNVYEKFLATNLFSPRTTLDVTDAYNLVSRKKLFTLLAIRLLTVLFTIRELIAISLPKSISHSMICEFYQFYGNPIPIHFSLIVGSIATICGPMDYNTGYIQESQESSGS